MMQFVLQVDGITQPHQPVGLDRSQRCDETQEQTMALTKEFEYDCVRGPYKAAGSQGNHRER